MDRGAWWVTAQRVAKRQTQTEVTARTHADKLKRIVVNFPHQVALVFFLSLNAPLRWRGNQQFVVWETKGSHHECFATYVVDFMDTRQFVIVHVFNIHTNFTFWGIWILVCYINYQRLFILCFKKKIVIIRMYLSSCIQFGENTSGLQACRISVSSAGVEPKPPCSGSLES